MFIAIILHKLPEGFTVSSIMMASGRSKASSLMAAAGLGVATMAGVLVMSAVQGLVKYGLPLSAGVTIYVAASDLMPEVNEEPGSKARLFRFWWSDLVHRDTFSAGVTLKEGELLQRA